MASTLAQLITKVRRQRIQELSAGTWSDDDIKDYLNQSAYDLANDTLCCERVFSAPVYDGIYQYILPSNFLMCHSLYQYDSDNEYQLLKHVDIEQLLTNQKITSKSNTLTHYAIWGQQANEICTGAPENSPTGAITEIVDTTYNFSNLLQPKDSGATRTIYRVIVQKTNSDGTIGLSEAAITSFSGNTITFSGGLQGGIDNFDSNTYYSIETYSDTRESLYVNPAPNWTDEDSYGDGFHSLRMFYYALPQEMEYDSDTCEIPRRWEPALLDKAESYAWKKVGDEKSMLMAEQFYQSKVQQIERQREIANIPIGVNIGTNRRRNARMRMSIDRGDYSATIIS